MEILKDIKKILRSSDFEIKTDDYERARFFSGSPLLDVYLGGGLPYIGTTYIQGGEAVGKTTLSYQILKSVIKQHNIIPIIIDTEESYDSKRFKSLVKDVPELLVVGLEYIEELKDLLDKIYDKIKNSDEDIDLFLIWDTISATPSREEYVNDMDKPATVARALSRMFRIIKLEKMRLTLFLISQYRETNITNPFITKEAPGGSAAKHKSDITLFLKQKKDDSVIDSKTGRLVKILTQKSRFISPWQEMEFIVLTNTGWNSLLTAEYILMSNKILTKSRGKLAYEGKVYSNEEFIEYLKNDLSIWERVFDLIIKDYNSEDKEYIKSTIYPKIISYYFKDNKIDLEKMTF